MGSAAAVKARMEDLTSGVKGLTISDDLEKTPKERADLFYSYVKQRLDDGVISKLNVTDIVTEADRLDVKDKAPLILCELLFNIQIISQIKTYCGLLSRFTTGNKKAQKSLWVVWSVSFNSTRTRCCPKLRTSSKLCT